MMAPGASKRCSVHKMLSPPHKLVIIFASVLANAIALDNGVALSPPMGWMSWQRYEWDIDEQMVKRTVDIMASEGYKQAGYQYICIDDGWSAKKRGPNGELVADRTKFPAGMKSLGDYIHNKGLKFGSYADVGSQTCGGYIGLNMSGKINDHYMKDIDTLASWGVDALKVDGCNLDKSLMHVAYPKVSKAINETGRPMWLSCSWPCYTGGCGGTPSDVGKPVYEQLHQYCNSWRDFDDIQDDYSSITSIIRTYSSPSAINLHNAVSGKGAFNDPDMLVIGGGGLSESEEVMQMVMWSIFSAPLVFSNDLANIPASSKALLLNKELIAVNQAIGTHNLTDRSSDPFDEYTKTATYCKNLKDGAIALAAVHLEAIGPPLNMTLQPDSQSWLPSLSNCMKKELGHHSVVEWSFRDVVAGKELGKGTEVQVTVPTPGAAMVVATPLKRSV